MINYREIVADPKRVYVIGDIHGCSAELKVLLTNLEQVEKVSEQDLIIFIGDYIDRGPDSMGVITQLVALKKKLPATVFLGGNHELMMFGCLANPLNFDQQDNWLKNGGAQTLLSYQVKADVAPELMITRFAEALPRDHRAFLEKLEKYVVFEDYCFVHAGVNPLRDLKAQLDQDIFWIRQEFINNIHYFKKTVIFGHTPFEDVMFHLPYKIGIDTGLVFGNSLSCLELKQKRILQVARNGSEVKERAFPPEEKK